MGSPTFATAEEYFAHLDDTKASTMRSVLRAVLSVSPELHAVIAWNVPQVKHTGGKYVFGMSAAKNHISLAPWSKAAMATHSSRLSDFHPTAGMFRVPVDWDVDVPLITDLVRERMAEIDA